MCAVGSRRVVHLMKTVAMAKRFVIDMWHNEQTSYHLINNIKLDWLTLTIYVA